VVLLAVQCALGTDEPGGGGHNLPHIDVVPIAVPAKPILFAKTGVRLSRPWGIERQSGAVELWVGAESDSEQRILNVGDGREFKAELDWEQGAVADPCVVGEWFAYTGAAGGGIGIADRAANGEWVRREAPVLTPGAAWEAGNVHHPSLVEEPDMSRTLLFYVAGDGAGIGVAAGTMAATDFERMSSSPILVPGAWSEAKTPQINGAAVYLTQSALGRPVYGCFYSLNGQLGYAAGFEPTEFVDFDLNPIVEESGFNLTEPMRVGQRVLHVRNAEKNKPAKGRVIGVANLSGADGFDLVIE
jgi:hypothetical protein